MDNVWGVQWRKKEEKEEEGGRGRKRGKNSNKCLTVLEVVLWGLHISGPLPWNSRKVVDLVLEVVRLESNGR